VDGPLIKIFYFYLAAQNENIFRGHVSRTLLLTFATHTVICTRAICYRGVSKGGWGQEEDKS